MKITVLGAGAWGTALAKVLHENGNAVTLWDIATDTLREIQGGRSERYLPGVKLPTDWKRKPILKKPSAARNAASWRFPRNSSGRSRRN